VLAVDELGVQEEFLGSALAGILAVARSKNLRLMAICQHLAQVSPALREALLSQSSFQAYFRLGHSDARIVGDALAAEEPDRIAEATVRVAVVDKLTGKPHLAIMRHEVRDGDGKPLAADPLLWRTLVWRDLFPTYSAPFARGTHPPMIDQLKAIAARAGITRLYVLSPDSGRPVEVSEYVDGLTALDFWFDGPNPVQLVVAFPRPKLASVRRLSAPARSRLWAQDLMRLGKQLAILRLRDARLAPATVRVADVPDVTPGEHSAIEEYARESLRHRGRTWPQAEREIAAREHAVEMLAKGNPAVQAATAPILPASKKARASSKSTDGSAAATAKRPARRSELMTVGRVADDGSIS